MRITRHLMLMMIVVSCTVQPDRQDQNGRILLVNAGEANRGRLASAIKRLSDCEPSVIGINFTFRSGNIESTDTLLSNAIRDAGNVVLVMLPKENDMIIRSDSMFVNSAIAEGLLYYGFDEDGAVTKQMMYISVNDDLLWSFPITLASYYDIEHSDEIMKSVAGNAYYTINQSNDKFEVIEIDTEYECSWIKGKIVLIGYLGPKTEDMFTFYDAKKYNTWILANCVEDIVNRRFERAN
jgi:CHASE2 domain-containing sensor protein